jgi:2',3'-cyclic-nucleotide 2'-phosphodiesterase (5'-nucleotidase family)
MDFAITNFGGIRVPMPKGAVTMEDISSMFPFKNYVCYVKMKGSGLLALFEQLSGTKAFQATSGATIRVKDHKLESALIGGQPIDPERVYNVTTIDFLLDGGDKINIGALAEDVTLSTVLLKEVMLWYVSGMEAKGEVIQAKADGRVIMED